MQGEGWGGAEGRAPHPQPPHPGAAVRACVTGTRQADMDARLLPPSGGTFPCHVIIPPPYFPLGGCMSPGEFPEVIVADRAGISQVRVLRYFYLQHTSFWLQNLEASVSTSKFVSFQLRCEVTQRRVPSCPKHFRCLLKAKMICHRANAGPIPGKMQSLEDWLGTLSPCPVSTVGPALLWSAVPEPVVPLGCSIQVFTFFSHLSIHLLIHLLLSSFCKSLSMYHTPG